MGQGEVLLLIDFEHDGRDEIVFGATTVNSLGARVAVMVDGVLRVVDVAGEPLTVEDGPFNADQDGTTAVFGCDPDDHLVQAMARVLWRPAGVVPRRYGDQRNTGEETVGRARQDRRERRRQGPDRGAR